MAYYTIREVTKKVGLSESTLRYYEKEELMPKIKRDSSGNRVYTDTDIEWISFLKILRYTNMPIHLIKKYVLLLQEGDKTVAARKELLESHMEKVQKEIEQKMKSLKILQAKISYYETIDDRNQQLSQRAFT